MQVVVADAPVKLEYIVLTPGTILSPAAHDESKSKQWHYIFDEYMLGGKRHNYSQFLATDPKQPGRVSMLNAMCFFMAMICCWHGAVCFFFIHMNRSSIGAMIDTAQEAYVLLENPLERKEMIKAWPTNFKIELTSSGRLLVKGKRRPFELAMPLPLIATTHVFMQWWQLGYLGEINSALPVLRFVRNDMKGQPLIGRDAKWRRNLTRVSRDTNAANLYLKFDWPPLPSWPPLYTLSPTIEVHTTLTQSGELRARQLGHIDSHIAALGWIFCSSDEVDDVVGQSLEKEKQRALAIFWDQLHNVFWEQILSERPEDEVGTFTCTKKNFMSAFEMYHFLFRTVGAYGMLTAMFTSTLFGEFGNDLKFVVFRMFPFIVGIHYLFKFLRRGLEGTRLAAASRWHRRIVTNILSFISGTSLPDPNLVLPREHEIYWKSQLNWSVPRRAASFCDTIKATLWGAGPAIVGRCVIIALSYYSAYVHLPNLSPEHAALVESKNDIALGIICFLEVNGYYPKASWLVEPFVYSYVFFSWWCILKIVADMRYAENDLMRRTAWDSAIKQAQMYATEGEDCFREHWCCDPSSAGYNDGGEIILRPKHDAFIRRKAEAAAARRSGVEGVESVSLDLLTRDARTLVESDVLEEFCRWRKPSLRANKVLDALLKMHVEEYGFGDEFDALRNCPILYCAYQSCSLCRLLTILANNTARKGADAVRWVIGLMSLDELKQKRAEARRLARKLKKDKDAVKEKEE